jgi:hypothetical protein
LDRRQAADRALFAAPGARWLTPMTHFSLQLPFLLWSAMNRFR